MDEKSDDQNKFDFASEVGFCYQVKYRLSGFIVYFLFSGSSLTQLDDQILYKEKLIASESVSQSSFVGVVPAK
jgi:hypothetical protein